MVEGRDCEEFLVVFDEEEASDLRRIASGLLIDVNDLIDDLILKAVEEFEQQSGPSKGLVH